MNERTAKREIYIGEACPTPIGPIWVAASEWGLIAVEFHDTRGDFVMNLERRYPRGRFEFVSVGLPDEDISLSAHIALAAVAQISEYLNGRRREFDLPIDWSVMTPFQERVLRATYAIPFGEVVTYGSIAAQIGRPSAARAVGRAQATNPMPLIIPCHRVIGSDGGLHGYGGRGGLDTKAWLLRLESASVSS